ncbi:glucose-6-phosphate isomerase [Bacteriovorax stolpii]|uniref:Glucose-6-phosphate isomerase n=1 Tax=Bacteriovorax stolpii TaxID=960 RepID=A0A2K9NUW1_BACTC|nr:glucose-6-phosphate isomerase [Bacteriovorax stolpii]AUN99309.1 glucose-6-phosphate isomerase [Bacteriovorax stolpii]QDK40710.1 glucose-6-phosphate isomerase [Bacteriovorax stolpii]TDP55151.1 glucose-6-phosphate isomerase [Bacteriovorax stolpii]
MAVKFQFHPERPYLSEDLTAKKVEIFKSIINNPRTQFFYTYTRSELELSSKAVFHKFKDRKIFVHIGIGGSSLGPEMLVSALGKSETKFIFINNVDPEEIHSQLQPLHGADLKDCLFYFVSKSGGTAETMAAMAIISQLFESRGIRPSEYKNYFVFATDPVKSELLTLAREWDITTLEVPSDVGGRFSALTPVGFLPALFAGLDINQLIQGAKDAQAELLSTDGKKNELIAAAEFLYELKIKKEISQTVFMPYSSKLRNLSFWFTQLWAESLGKKKNKRGDVINVGFTPIVAYGATDQHSQVQLFMEGPNDKAYIIVEVEKFAHDFPLHSVLSTNNLQKLSGFKLSDLIKAEMEGTIKALREQERAVLHVKIAKNDEYHLAQLVLFFESLTALMGDYLMIDPFDQPGVEAGKIYAFEFLNQL